MWKYWYIPLFTLVAILIWAATRKGRTKGTPLAQTLREVEAIGEAARIKKEIIKVGARAARKAVEVKYATELMLLDKEMKAEAKQIGDDPAALAKYIIRARR